MAELTPQQKGAITRAANAQKKQQGTKLPEQTDALKDVKMDVNPAPEVEQANPDPTADVSLPVVEVEEQPDVVAVKPSPWMDVEHLSDDEMLVQAVNLHSHGQSSMLLRFKVGNQFVGTVQSISRMHYKPRTGKLDGKFITR